MSVGSNYLAVSRNAAEQGDAYAKAALEGLESLLKGEQVTTDRAKAQASFWSTPIQALVRAGRELTIRRPLPELFRVILDLGMEAVRRVVLENLDPAMEEARTPRPRS